jgi:hypothetical protein
MEKRWRCWLAADGLIRGPRRDSDREMLGPNNSGRCRVGASDPWLPSHMEQEPRMIENCPFDPPRDGLSKHKMAFRCSQNLVATGVRRSTEAGESREGKDGCADTTRHDRRHTHTRSFANCFGSRAVVSIIGVAGDSTNGTRWRRAHVACTTCEFHRPTMFGYHVQM